MNKRSASASRQKILDVAIGVFSEHGYEGSSMRMIAARAGMSVGGLYLYYKNKESLYSTLVEKVLEDLSAEMEETLQKIADPVAAMRALVSMRLQYARKNRELIVASAKGRKPDVGVDLRTRFLDRQRRLTEGIIARGIESGDFAQCDAREAARVIIGMVRGFVFSLVADPDNLFSGEECCRMLLDGLRKRDEKKEAE